MTEQVKRCLHGRNFCLECHDAKASEVPAFSKPSVLKDCNVGYSAGAHLPSIRQQREKLLADVEAGVTEQAVRDKLVALGWTPPGEQHEAVPEETPHIIVFDDADRPNEMFSGAGARPAALRRWEQISVSWNAHLFVRVERNSRDDPYPCARLASQVNRIPAGLYAELEALRTLRDAADVYLQGYMRDEIEDEESCSTDQHDAACSVKSALDNARALEWKGGGEEHSHG